MPSFSSNSKNNTTVIKMDATKPVLSKSLNSPEVINQFAQDFVSFQNKWSQLNLAQRTSAIAAIVNKTQKSVGVPTGRIEPNSAAQNAGEFLHTKWLINVNSKLLNSGNVLLPEVAEELALTLYHEMRHSEQFFRIAQKEALKFNDNGKLKNSAQISLETEIPEVIVNQAVASVQNLTPEQKKQLLKELAITDSWYRSLYPKTPAEAEVGNKLSSTLASTYKVAIAAQEKYDFARNHTRQFSWSQINKLEAVATEAKKQYEIARAAFIKGLPEEADAEATEKKFRAAYINKLTTSRQRKTQNTQPSTNRNKSEEDWTDKFYNRNTIQELPEDSSIDNDQSLILESGNSTKNSQSVVIKPDSADSPTLYQQLIRIAKKMPHNLEKLGLDPQNSRHQEIFMTMYAINTGIDPRQLLKDSPYSSQVNKDGGSDHAELVVLQATAKMEEAAKASTTLSTARNIDRGL
jgi:hypothetical protein